MHPARMTATPRDPHLQVTLLHGLTSDEIVLRLRVHQDPTRETLLPPLAHTYDVMVILLLALLDPMLEATPLHLDHSLVAHRHHLNPPLELRLRILRRVSPLAHVEHQLPSVEMQHLVHTLKKCMTRVSLRHSLRKHPTAQQQVPHLHEHEFLAVRIQVNPH